MNTNILEAAYKWVMGSPERAGEFIDSLLKNGAEKPKRQMSPSTREKLRLAAVKRWEIARRGSKQGNGKNGLRAAHGNSK